MRPALIALFLAGVWLTAQATRDASLSVKILDAAGKPTPARVRLLDAQGKPPKATGAQAGSTAPLHPPAAAIAVMYGRNDVAEGYLLQPDGAFYVDGGFDLSVPPGTYSLIVSKGQEYLRQSLTLEAGPGRRLERTIRLGRWIDMPARGWYSADDHVHIRRSPRDNPAILRWFAAEDIHAGNLLQMGDFWTTVYSQYEFGKAGRYSEPGYLLSPGQEEPRTPEIGHTISLGADEFVRFRSDYYSYDRVFDRVHERNGVSGFAHQGYTFHGDRGMTLTVLRGKVDFLELAQFCSPEGPIALDNYYRFLDLGYRLTALAGSDFPWCGIGPRFGVAEGTSQIGDARFYTYTGDRFDFDSWMAGVKAGHTFVSTGPVVDLLVNGARPGDTLPVARGAKLRIEAKAWGHGTQVPLQELEIVGHSRTLKSVKAGAAGQSAQALSVELEMAAEHGVWIAARARGGRFQAAHTTPVYVTVDGGGFANLAAREERVAECEQSLAELEKELENPGNQLDSQASRHRKALERQIAEARRVLRPGGAR
jgi:hypothetical protein